MVLLVWIWKYEQEVKNFFFSHSRTTYGLSMFVVDEIRNIRLFTETHQSVVQCDDFRVLQINENVWEGRRRGSTTYFDVQWQGEKRFMNDGFLISGTLHDRTEFPGKDLGDETFLHFILVKRGWSSETMQSLAYRANNVRTIAFAHLKPIFSFLIAIQLQIRRHRRQVRTGDGFFYEEREREGRGSTSLLSLTVLIRWARRNNLTDLFMNLVQQLTQQFMGIFLFILNQFDRNLTESSQFLQNLRGIERWTTDDISIVRIRFGAIHFLELIDEWMTRRFRWRVDRGRKVVVLTMLEWMGRCDGRDHRWMVRVSSHWRKQDKQEVIEESTERERQRWKNLVDTRFLPHWYNSNYFDWSIHEVWWPWPMGEFHIWKSNLTKPNLIRHPRNLDLPTF